MTEIDDLLEAIQDHLDTLHTIHGIKSKTLLGMPDHTIRELTGRSDVLCCRDAERRQGYYLN
jgi:hypothetical protein